MTIKELYEWAVSKGIENYTVEIQYRDSEGFYNASDDLYVCDAKINHYIETLTI